MEILSEVGPELPDDPDEACRRLLDRALADGHAHDDVALRRPPRRPTRDARPDPARRAGLAGRSAPGARPLAPGERRGDADAYEIQVACGEACSNAITHAYLPGEAHFAVRASRDGDELSIEVSDFGAWRPPRGGQAAAASHFIEQLTDSLEIDRGSQVLRFGCGAGRATGVVVRQRRGVGRDARSIGGSAVRRSAPRR